MGAMIRAAALVALLGGAASPQEKKPDEKKMKHTNRLAKEKSPYLLQHAHNPVDWYPWGAEAFEKAKKEDKPIFLSIGYSTCHWCHVMERQSFEDDEVARVLNASFVPVKVDREERPDVDQIYMAAVTSMNQGRGGWPLSAWLTPERKPFYGGTYYPRENFLRLLDAILDAWKHRRGELDGFARQMEEHLQKRAEADGPGEVDADRVLRQGALLAERNYEPEFGGFSGAPKFPHSTTIQFLLRVHRRTGSKDALAMAEKSLVEMARGGIYDQLGGGFHRYSTDAKWIVPHFEKMLYDNALLAVAYLEAFLVTKKEFYARIARETLDYVLRDMTSKEGAFYSAEDADSEKIEGKFYVWNPAQVSEVLGEKEAARFMKAFDVTPEGNWEPHEPDLPRKQSVLRAIEEGDFAEAKRRLFEARRGRVRPGLDDKVLTAWNALMVSAMAQAAQVLGDARYRDAAVRAASFLLERHRKEGRLLRTSRLGEAKLEGYLEDYAYLAAALLDLYETTFDPAFFEEARRLSAQAVELFWDEKAGGFFATARGSADLIARMREEYEGPMPTANAVLAAAFLRLHSFTGEASWRERAEKTVRSFKAELERYAAGQCFLLCAIDALKGPAREIVVAGPDPEPFLRVVRAQFMPGRVVALGDPKAKIPLLEGKGPVKGKTAAYVCENMACKLPVTEPAELEAMLKK
jgi:hypothetical protein